MKKYILMLFLLPFCTASAKELRHYADIASAVANGKSVNFVLHLFDCAGDIKQRPIRGFIHPNAIIINDSLQDEKITFSHHQFTMNHPDYNGTAIYNYATFRIFPEDTATVSFKALNASTFEVLGAHAITCALGKGIKAFD